MTGLVQAVRYLTIVPVPDPSARPQQRAPAMIELGRSAVWFPIVGLGLGAVLAAVQWVAARVFPPLLVGLLTIATWKLMTGGLHLDGLADCLDGLGGRDAEHRLAIMRESQIGAFAAVGLILVLLADVAALAETDEGLRWRVLMIAPTVARAAPPALARLFGPARRDGHGTRFMASVGRVSAVLAAALAMLAAAVLLGWAGMVVGLGGMMAALLVGWLLARRLGGLTGDVLGAAVEIAEMTVLLVGAAWARGRP